MAYNRTRSITNANLLYELYVKLCKLVLLLGIDPNVVHYVMIHLTTRCSACSRCSDRSIAVYDLRMSSPARKLIMQVTAGFLNPELFLLFFPI